MRWMNLSGWRVLYGKRRNRPYEASFYPPSSNIAVKSIDDCESEQELFIKIGYELAVLDMAEVHPVRLIDEEK